MHQSGDTLAGIQGRGGGEEGRRGGGEEGRRGGLCGLVSEHIQVPVLVKYLPCVTEKGILNMFNH